MLFRCCAAANVIRITRFVPLIVNVIRVFGRRAMFGAWEPDCMQPLVACALAGKCIFQASYCSSIRFIPLVFL